MNDKTTYFLGKHGIDPSDVMYIVISDHKTAIHMNDGKVRTTYIAMKDIVGALPEEMFVKINKSCVVSWKHITRVEKGRYFMTDGSVHSGRMRTPAEHSRNSAMVEGLKSRIGLRIDPSSRRYDILEDMGVGFMVLELIYDAGGLNMNFFIRYCNRCGASMINHRREELIDQSLIDSCPMINKKIAFRFADVALNGVPKDLVIHDTNSSRVLMLHCFQIKPDQCALTMKDISSRDDVEHYETALPTRL